LKFIFVFNIYVFGNLCFKRQTMLNQFILVHIYLMLRQDNEIVFSYESNKMRENRIETESTNLKMFTTLSDLNFLFKIYFCF